MRVLLRLERRVWRDQGVAADTPVMYMEKQTHCAMFQTLDYL